MSESCLCVFMYILEQRLPPECPASEKNVSPIHVEASNQPPAAPQTCYSLHSKNDPALTVMLTQVH